MQEHKFGIQSLINPKEGVTIIEPPGKGNGYWAGAPSVYYDKNKRKFYLSYRLREPRPRRGYESRISESADGKNFTDIWSMKKEDLKSISIERSAILLNAPNDYRLYISYVDTVDNRWRIDMMESDTPEHFDPSLRKPVLNSKDLNVEGVKDPYLIELGEIHYMFFSYAPKLLNVSSKQEEEPHSTGDIFNTRMVKSLTGLAESPDGLSFKWLRNVSSLSSGWDSHTFRITCVLPAREGFIIFYDGASRNDLNYEETTGVAVSKDLVEFKRISKQHPMLISPYVTGSLRYVNAIDVGEDIYFYYEFCREDGSHELRLNILKRNILNQLYDSN